MIISKFEGEDRSANVCRHSKEWVVMCYKNDNFIKELIALNEQIAEDIAENWIYNESV